MFESLRENIDRGTSRFSRNVAALAGKRSPKPLRKWSRHDERRYASILVSAGLLTIWQWMALPFRLLRERWSRTRIRKG
ncbi:MAG TPA: hypothetical protein VM779_08730 [Thermoanaerobaculia bacterium]|nr:hypothetical protein [Thermoanaerobaculia bacterium]